MTENHNSQPSVSQSPANQALQQPPIQPLPQEVTQDNTTPQKPKKMWIFIGLIIIAILVFIYIGVSAFRNIHTENGQPSTNEISSSTSTTSPESVTQASDPITDWKTYTNTEYGYALKYPSGWSLQEKNTIESNAGHPYMYNKNDVQGISITDTDTTWPVTFSLVVRKNINNLSTVEWNEEFQSNEKYLLRNIPNPIKAALGGIETNKYLVFSGDYTKGIIGVAISGYIYIIEHPDDKENLNDEKIKYHNEVYAQILSSFKFLD